MVLTVAQMAYISNVQNKSRFIKILSTYLNNNGYTVIHAADDADTTIIKEAISRAQNESEAIVVGEDVDLLVLLIALTPEENNNIFLKPRKGNNGKYIYFTREAQKLNGHKQSILFLHSISGCNTVLCFFNVGKLKHFKLLKKYPDLQNIIDIFNNPN